MAVFRSCAPHDLKTASGERCVADVRDGCQEDVTVFIKECGGTEIEFTILSRCTVDDV